MQSPSVVSDTVILVPWTSGHDVKLCKEILKNLKSIKYKAKANKKEEATLNLKNMKDFFIDDEKSEDDVRSFYRQVKTIYTKWVSYNRTIFKSNSENENG